MPGMIACCRRWYVSTDDWVYPGIRSILFYGAGLAVVAIVFTLHRDGLETCEDLRLVKIYYIGMIVLLATHIVVSMLLCFCSMQGTIVDIQRRRTVPIILYIKAIVFLPEIIWLFVGTYWAFLGSGKGCSMVVVMTVKALVMVGWVMFLSMLVGVVVVFDPLGHRRRRSHALTSTTGSFYMDKNTDGAGAATKQLWNTRCKLLCCCAMRDENSNNAFDDIAQLLTNFFEGLDLVPTDIAAGLILVQKEQRNTPLRFERSVVILRSPVRSPLHKPHDKAKISKKERKQIRERVASARTGITHTQSLDGGSNSSGAPGGPWVHRSEAHAYDRSISAPVQPSDVLMALSTETSPLVSPVYETPNNRTSCASSNNGNTVNGITTDCITLTLEGSTSTADIVEVNVSGATKDGSPKSHIETLGDSCNTDILAGSTSSPCPTDNTDSTPAVGTSINQPCHSEPKGWMSIHNATHYMRYAMGSYGWPLYMYTNLPLGCCKLLAKCRCCCQGSQNHNVYYDNSCQCHTAAIHNFTGIEPEDIVYASFHNAIYQIPFYVALDHSRSAVIVAIRGTLSFRDALTDLTAESQEMNIQGVETPCKAHKGIAQAASYVYKMLHDNAILQEAFSVAPNYELIITGHSLGAGAAALLSIMLRDSYTDLKCFAFSPPGGLLSKSLARYTEDFICSVVLGHDLVPRLGIVSMENLKTQVLRCIKDSRKPKYKILAGGVWSALCGFRQSEDERGSSTSQPLLPSSIRLGIPCYGTREETLSERALEDAIVTSGRSRQVSLPLYPPGQIIFIEEETPGRFCCGGAIYKAAWARGDVFSEILVSPKMLTDHLPDAVFKALMQLADKNFHMREMVRIRRESLEEGLI